MKNSKPITWLEWRSQETGKSVEELREEMRQRGKLADKSRSGFASRPALERQMISKLGVEARRAKKSKDTTEES